MKLSIFDYMNVRLFLKDFYESEKASGRPFSYAAWATALNLSNKTILRMMLQGKRKISPRTRDQFALYFKFSDLEKEYFEILVDYSQATSETQRKSFGLRLIQVQRKTVQQKTVPAQSGLLEDVYAPLVLTLISSSEPLLTISAIAKCFNLEEERIHRIAQTLTSAGLLVAKDGFYIAAQNSFKISDHLGSEGLRNYYRYWLDRSAKAIDLPTETRRFRSLQVVLSKAEFQEVVDRLNEFAITLISRFEKNTMDSRSLYLINAAVFPVQAAAPKDSLISEANSL